MNDARRAERPAEAKHLGKDTVLVWLRSDLRVDDNPALAHAAATGSPVLVLYVLEDVADGVRASGAALKWWLHRTLSSFGKSLEALGGVLILRRGDPRRIVPAIAREAKAGALFYNRRYDEGGRAIDAAVERSLSLLVVERFDANILHDPDAVTTKTSGYYRVYTPFWKNLAGGPGPRDPIDAPQRLRSPKGPKPASDDVGDWKLLPTKPDWSAGLAQAWTPGEAAARDRFEMFCDGPLGDYHNGRDRPDKDATSRMSPYLSLGTVSPQRLWQWTERAAAQTGMPGSAIETYKKELVWRDFNYHLLYHVGRIEAINVNARFDAFPWRHAPDELRAWQRGMTGYPAVDAAMRQLWQTGWMHNRMRMVVASFLTKDLLIDWREGERWFWDTLIDADAASNTAQWQWVAGSGADAQPFFRIFNPVSQSQKFDAKGDYIRRFVPELAKMPDKAIHAPWEADRKVLEYAGVVLGTTYPRPMVDHAMARQRALDAYEATKE